MKTADEIIGEIQKRISEALVLHVGKKAAAEVEVRARLAARRVIFDVLKENEIPTDDLAKLQEGAVFYVTPDPADPSATRVHLRPTIREAIEKAQG